MQEVDVGRASPSRLKELLSPERARRLETYAREAARMLSGRIVWNISSTAQGGGVAELLTTLLAQCRGAGVEARWLVIDGDPEFFALTKRIHNMLHGQPGDGGRLGDRERDLYQRVLAVDADVARGLVRPGDIVLLHDPQTAGMVAALQASGAHVVWRCHVGRDAPNELTDAAWAFLRPYVEAAEATVFSRAQYVPPWLPRDRAWVIPPSLDPFSAKNAALGEAEVRATLHVAGLVDVPDAAGTPTFTRRDGTVGTVRPHEGLLVDQGPVPGDARVVLQVSRWDRLKDMSGVLAGFTDHIDLFPDDVHLLLVGPEVTGVSDDPEGKEVLDECRAQWGTLPAPVRARTHLCCLPMDDVDENAHIVNALQRHATVVVQKSLVEGFGLTVTEPMWKARPVVASAVGGIQDQIVDGVSGVLLPDPADLRAFAATVAELLADPARAGRLGAGARERVRDRFLGDRHLIQYAVHFEQLVSR